MHTPIKIDKLTRTKRKSICLEITQDGQLIIRAPKRLSMQWINSYLQQKSQWILTKQQQLKATLSLHPGKKFVEGENFLFLGQNYPLTVVPTHNVEIAKHIIPILAFNNEFQLRSDQLIAAKALLTNWYRQQAKIIITERVLFYSSQHNFQFKKIKFSNAKTRWGSCSHLGNLNFNWRLIMAPVIVIDYVIIHELAHLKEMNHSKKFWRIVESIMPNYQYARKWLKENSRKLNW